MEAYGWNVVYACSGAYINQQLQANTGSCIQDFEYEDEAIQLTGTFGSWQIVPGGNGNIIQFNMPITQGSVTIKSTSQTILLDGVVPLVQLQLAIVTTPAQTVLNQLVFNCTTLGSGPGDPTAGAVSVVDPDTGNTLQSQPGGEIAKALLMTGLGNCLLQHADQLTFVFASVLPLPAGQNSNWLMPTCFEYCYQQPVDNTLGGIAILGLLGGKQPNGLSPYFDTTLLQNQDVGFILSADQFMANVVLPALPAALKGNAALNNFTINGAAIQMETSFNLNNVKVGLIDYTPNVTALQFQLEDNYMQCYIATHTKISGLADAYVTNSVTSKNQVSFNCTNRTISFVNDPNMTVTKDVSIPWWEKALGALTLGIMNVVIECISLAIENAGANITSSQTAKALGAVAPGLVSWNGQNTVTINAGGLADNVFMQGTLNS
jgi:hypothetical protein